MALAIDQLGTRCEGHTELAVCFGGYVRPGGDGVTPVDDAVVLADGRAEVEA